VRTLTLAIPSGHTSFAGFAAGKTYLVRLSGTVGFEGTPLGLLEAPGAFSVNNVGNDVLFARLQQARLALPGKAGNYQFAAQPDADGKALRYNVAPAIGGKCAVLPEQPALPGRALDLVGGLPPWKGTVKAEIFVYEAAATPSTPAAPVAGTRYKVSVPNTTLRVFGTRPTFVTGATRYSPTGERLRLLATFTYRADGSAARLSGTAAVNVLLKKVGGPGPARKVIRLHYRLPKGSQTPAAPGFSFEFDTKLVSPKIAACDDGLIGVSAGGLITVDVCRIEAQGSGQRVTFRRA
jgi:hypothetical protein